MKTPKRFTTQPVYISAQRKQKTGELSLYENDNYIGRLPDKRFADLICAALNHVFETAALTREGDLMPDGTEFEIPNDVTYSEHSDIIDECRAMVAAYEPTQPGLSFETTKKA